MHNNCTYDFHLHTECSDGQISPEELWQHARERGLTGISITDHDTIDAYDRLEDAPLIGHANRPRGELWLLPGVEFSTSTNGEELHVLGYFPQGVSSGLRGFVEEILAGRERRMARGIRGLRERGIDISLTECRKEARGRALSRTHVAEVLWRKRYVQRPRQAYAHLLGQGVFPSSEADTAEVIGRIGELGGVSVWAHPKEAQLERRLESLVSAGLHGVEVYTPWRQKGERLRILRTVESLGLLVTAGSDWHGQTGVRAGRFRAEERLVREFLGRIEACLGAGGHKSR